MPLPATGLSPAQQKAQQKKQKTLDRKMYNAVKAGDFKITEKLLAEGGDPNAPVGKKGITAMHRVASTGNRKLALLLESQGGKRVSAADATTLPDDEIDAAMDEEHVFNVGDKVMLGPGAEDELDAMYGPLGPGEVAEVVAVNPKLATPIKVRDLSGELYAYTANALVPAKMDGGAINDADFRGRLGTVVQEFTARLEKQHAEAEQQKTIKPVRERFSRIANGTIRSRPNSVRGKSDDDDEEGGGAEEAPRTRKKSTAALMLSQELEAELFKPPSPAPAPKSGKGKDKGKGGVKDWEFDRSKLKMGEQLGEGNFGVVYEGKATGIGGGKKVTKVAVKTLSSSEMEEEFHTEAEIMKDLSESDHIVRLLGLCTKESPFMMLMELMSNGDLKEVLRKNRPKKKKESRFSWKSLGKFAHDVTMGMTYLADRKIVHRDMAARNCLVNEDYVVKIGDFGLTRNIYSSEYYRCTGSAPLPIRWMAPESIEDGIYTGQSDVWSFGVVLWEIGSFAKLPYGLLSNMEVCEKVVEDDFRMPCPKGCPSEVHALMTKCWQLEPDDRPTFHSLEADLRALVPKLNSKPIGYHKKSIAAPDAGADEAGAALHPKVVSPGGHGEYIETAENASPPVEENYLKVNTSKDSKAAEPDGSALYYSTNERGDAGDAQLYTDQRYSHLPDMQMAIKMAQAAKDVKPVEKDEAAPVQVVETDASRSEVVNEDTIQKPEDIGMPAGRPLSQDAGADSGVSGKTDTATSSPKSMSPSSTTHKPPSHAKLLAEGAAAGVKTLKKRPADSPKQVSPQTTSSSLAPTQESVEPKNSATSDGTPEWVEKSKAGLNREKNKSHMKIAHRAANVQQMEDETAEWIEATLEIKLDRPLQKALRSGQILCALLNALKPGMIKKIHAKKLAPMQRENIGWFLEGVRKFGVSESDCFMTNDLFEDSDMRQVLICLQSLHQQVEKC